MELLFSLVSFIHSFVRSLIIIIIIINFWNKMPDSVVSAASISSFKGTC